MVAHTACRPHSKYGQPNTAAKYGRPNTAGRHGARAGSVRACLPSVPLTSSDRLQQLLALRWSWPAPAPDGPAKTSPISVLFGTAPAVAAPPGRPVRGSRFHRCSTCGRNRHPGRAPGCCGGRGSCRAHIRARRETGTTSSAGVLANITASKIGAANKGHKTVAPKGVASPAPPNSTGGHTSGYISQEHTT